MLIYPSMESDLATCTFIVAVIFSSTFELCCCVCARAEYEINGECCPMCAPGNRVLKHCTEYTSTTCIPCLETTYTDESNGLTECLICTVCDPGQHLRVKKSCTRSSDTVCEPLEGYYCTDQDRYSCRQAVEHTECRPGQYIKHKGTAVKDTECAECTDGTYSNGSLQICQPHLKCEDLGLTEIKGGTHSSDVECGSQFPASLIAGIIIPVLILGVVAVIVFLKIKNKIVLSTDCFSQSAVANPTQESELEDPTTPSSVVPMLSTESRLTSSEET